MCKCLAQKQTAGAPNTVDGEGGSLGSIPRHWVLSGGEESERSEAGEELVLLVIPFYRRQN